MRKLEEMKVGCMSKAGPTEMVFVLRANDPAAPFAIRQWIKERVRLGLEAPNDPKLTEARQVAGIMEAECPPWQPAIKSPGEGVVLEGITATGTATIGAAPEVLTDFVAEESSYEPEPAE